MNMQRSITIAQSFHRALAATNTRSVIEQRKYVIVVRPVRREHDRLDNLGPECFTNEQCAGRFAGSSYVVAVDDHCALSLKLFIVFHFKHRILSKNRFVVRSGDPVAVCVRSSQSNGQVWNVQMDGDGRGKQFATTVFRADADDDIGPDAPDLIGQLVHNCAESRWLSGCIIQEQIAGQAQCHIH
jgi:hypothetical protein